MAQNTCIESKVDSGLKETNKELVGTVLLVDDEPYNLRLLEEILSNTDLNLVFASNGREALELVYQLAPDLILLDVMMPDMNGIDVCAELKSSKNWRAIPIVMVTALDSVSDYVDALAAGADDFISKPVNSQILMARVRSYLRSKRLADDVTRLWQLKNDLTHMIVHDLRTPLTGISGFLELLGEKGLPNDSAELIEKARWSVRNLASLIEDVLSVEKFESGTLQVRPEEVNLQPMVNYAIDTFLHARLDKGLEITLSGSEEMTWFVQEDLFQRVIQNLLTNAVKFAPKGTNIDIQYQTCRDAVTFTIANHGAVISAKDRHRLFDKFAQVDDGNSTARSGFGLGLAFCKLVVDAHGGQIGVRSPAPGWEDGVQFFVEIPATPTVSFH